jgi:hypothetical protein
VVVTESFRLRTLWSAVAVPKGVPEDGEVPDAEGKKLLKPN